MMKYFKLSAVVISMLIAASANAGMRDGSRAFNHIDENGDGAISEAEIRAGLV